jgi:hypothetical protein
MVQYKKSIHCSRWPDPICARVPKQRQAWRKDGWRPETFVALLPTAKQYNVCRVHVDDLFWALVADADARSRRHSMPL